MKHLLLTTIAAVVLVGCGKSQTSEPPTAKALDISIHDAVKDENIEAVKQHLAAGTDMDAKNNNEWTALDCAVFYDRSEIAELLIDAGADVNVKNGLGQTPLDCAMLFKHPKTADVLRKHGGKSGVVDSIYVAVELGNIEAVKQHLAAGVDVNAKADGRDPLLQYARTKAVTELLIAQGADVNAYGSRGITFLHDMAMFGYKEIAELLIAKGADVNAKDEDGETPLDTTYIFNKTETADLLRKHGGKTGEELKAEGN